MFRFLHVRENRMRILFLRTFFRLFIFIIGLYALSLNYVVLITPST